MTGFKFIRDNVLNLSMSELAKIMGVSKQAIYLWEIGKNRITDDRLTQLSEFSGIPSEYFLKENLTSEEEREIRLIRIEKEVNNSANDENVILDEILLQTKSFLLKKSNTDNDSYSKSLLLKECIKFLDKNLEIQMLFPILSGINMYFNEQSKKGELPDRIPECELDKEKVLTREIYNLLYSYKAAEIEMNREEKNKYLKELKEKYDK